MSFTIKNSFFAKFVPTYKIDMQLSDSYYLHSKISTMKISYQFNKFMLLY